MLTNTATRYGAISRLLHWIIALLVLTALALGGLGKLIPRTANTVEFLQLLYSTHKTIGVTVLALAILRVVWAFTRPRPVPLHPERKAETYAAEVAHWLLYAAIFVLPLSGWVMHSAEIGYAPIWWPFAQNLPFIPKSETLAATAASVHLVAAIVMATTVAAHIGGALKHSFIDRDGTLARMVRGTQAGDPKLVHTTATTVVVVALTIWSTAIGAGVAISMIPGDNAAPTLAPVTETAGWAVQDGTVSITITQLGAPVTGSFGAWQATIDYDPATGAGEVTAMIDTTSLTLGSVSDQAKGPEFFDVANFARAEFVGTIMQTEGPSHTATGTLTLVGQGVPVVLEFDLDLSDTTATMSGTTTLDRRDFGMGVAYGDESSVGFTVEVSIELTATQVQ